MQPDQQQQVAPTPLPEPQLQPSAPAAPAKKSHKNMPIAIIVAAVLIVAGAGYAAYAYVMNLPDNLLQSAIDAASKQRAMAAKFTIVSGTNPQTTFTGDVAFTADTSNDKNGEVIVGVGSGSSRLAISALLLDGALYLKGTNLEAITSMASGLLGGEGDTSALGSGLKNLDNQWFGLRKSDIESLAKSSGNDAVSGAVSPDDLKKMLDLYKQHAFIKADKTYADEAIDGANSAHFSVKIDKDQEVAFLQAVKNANLATIKLSDQDIADVKNDNNPMQDTTLELWITRGSRTFKQVKFASTKPGEEATLTLTLSGQLPTFDKFEKPAGSKPFSELFSSLLGTPESLLDENDFGISQNMQ